MRRFSFTHSSIGFFLKINFEQCVNRKKYCQPSDLGLRLEVDFDFPLSQEQQEEEQQQQPLTKIYRIE